uniref:Translocon-associated protein subunit beta n=1 Tax=Hirondellea gigas TaxID=1518452 RepID=A0A2P2HWL1_9CRUS
MKASLLMLLLSVLVLSTLVASIGTEGVGAVPDRARLLASKRVHNLYLVEGQDIVVQYSLYNIGTAPALNVQLTDAGFSSENFEIAAGQLQVKFDRIAPGANVTHSIVVRPTKSGLFNFTAAEVSYLPSEDSVDVQVGFTSEPGQGGVISQRDYDKKFSPHVFDWIIFALLLVPALLVHFLMWRDTSSKYISAPKPTVGKGSKKN